MKKCAFLALAASVFLGSSCLKPHYQRPILDIPESWRLENNPESTLCTDHFWEQFNDPVLNQLVEIALKNNHDVKIAIWRVQEYYALFRITSSAFYPSLYATGNYTRMKSPIALDTAATSLPTTPTNDSGGGSTTTTTTTPLTSATVTTAITPITNQYEGFLSSSWELDLWGRIYSSSEASYSDLLGQIEARRGVVLSLVTSVINSYIGLRELDAELLVSKQTFNSRIESLKLAEDRFKLGETSLIEVRQAQAEVQSAAIRVVEFERDIPKKENELAVLIGQNPSSIERGLPLKDFVYPAAIPTGLPSELLLRRPDIVQAENQLMAANARISEARALYFPQISLTGAIGSISDQLKSFATYPTNFWEYSVNALWPIFTGGQIYFNVKRTEAVHCQAVENYKKTILNAFKEVNDALVDYEKNRQLVTEHQIQVKVLKDYLKLAQLRYAEGEIDYLNVLDAERSLFDAQLELVSAEAASLTAVVQVYKTLGGGWVDEADASLFTSCQESLEG